MSYDKFAGYWEDYSRTVRTSGGGMCERPGCGKTIIFLVTMAGAGSFCSHTCGEAQARALGLWPADGDLPEHDAAVRR